MKVLPGKIIGCSLVGNTLQCNAENAKINIEISSSNILKITYNPNNYTVPKHLAEVSSYLDEMKPDYDNQIVLDETEAKVCISWEDKKVTVTKENGNIAVFVNNTCVHGGELGNKDTVISHSQFRLLGHESEEFGRFTFPIDNADSFYGLGDKGGNPNRFGRRFRMFNRDSLGYDAQYSDPLYKSIPFFMKSNKNNHSIVGFYYPESLIQSFDFGAESVFYYAVDITGGPFTYYVLLGNNYKDIIKDYYMITGFPAFPPLYSFGYFGSSMNYVEAWDAQKRMAKFFDDVEKYNLPCEGLYVSSGYLKADDGSRYSFFWNKRKFPDPKSFISGLAQRGYHLTFNIKPGVLTTHPWYEELNEKGYFVKDNEGNAIKEFFWGGVASFVDFSNPEASNWWKTKLNETYFDFGAEGIWNDNNEFELEDTNLKAFGTRAIYPVKMSQVAYEASLERYPDRRPWIYSRSGYAKLQKFARSWTGDNTSLFKTLYYNQFQAVSMGLSGLPYIGNELGGF
ncbi:MAG: glycoside hydrolase, partial [Sphaerochaetaceae bacterium]|nr:glycoside hydrolase [Sphaerochaetaceae bacterium]